MLGGFDYRFTERKPKHGIARVRIKSITVPYDKRPRGTAIDNLGHEYLQRFRENGRTVETIMKMVARDSDVIRFERIA